MSPGEVAFKLAFQICPIYLTGGIAGSMPGATVPLISFTQGDIFGSILDIGLSSEEDLDRFFAHFRPLPGATLLNNSVGQFPFANRAVAANAIIFEPLQVSLLMTCPVQTLGGYPMRQSTLSSLKRTLDAHNLAGGTYSIATPGYLYTDCLFVRMTDASTGETKQVQYQYQLDFLQPLVTQEGAQQAYNNLMSVIGAQTQLQPNGQGQISWSGLGNTVNNDASGASTTVVPGNQGDPGLGFAPASQNAGGTTAAQGFSGAPETTTAFTTDSASSSAGDNASDIPSNVDVSSITF